MYRVSISYRVGYICVVNVRSIIPFLFIIIINSSSIILRIIITIRRAAQATLKTRDGLCRLSSREVESYHRDVTFR